MQDQDGDVQTAKRYAESVIGDNAANYDGIEIQHLSNRGRECLDNDIPEAFSVFVHLKPEGVDESGADIGGVECVGDFATHPLAVEYANELSEKYGWVVRDFSPQQQADEEDEISSCRP